MTAFLCLVVAHLEWPAMHVLSQCRRRGEEYAHRRFGTARAALRAALSLGDDPTVRPGGHSWSAHSGGPGDGNGAARFRGLRGYDRSPAASGITFGFREFIQVDADHCFTQPTRHTRDDSGVFVVPGGPDDGLGTLDRVTGDRKSTRLNSSHVSTSYAVFCLPQKTSE